MSVKSVKSAIFFGERPAKLARQWWIPYCKVDWQQSWGCDLFTSAVRAKEVKDLDLDCNSLLIERALWVEWLWILIHFSLNLI